MSEEKQTTDEATATEEAPKKKAFTRATAKPHIEIAFTLPMLYPDYEPWVFKLNYSLSGEAEKRRQKYLTMAPAARVDKLFEQNLDELCDLMVALPTGFGDLTDVPGQKPGVTFMNYVKSTSDHGAKESLSRIVSGAIDLYWTASMPREFRQSV